MQTKTAPGNPNPLLQETSTLGVPFWQILASTTGGLLTPAVNPTAGLAGNAQDADTAKGGPDPSAADFSQTVDATAQPNAKALATIPSLTGRVATDTAILAQKIVSSVTGQKATRQPAPSQTSASGNASSASGGGNAIAATVSVPPETPAPLLNTGATPPAVDATCVGTAAGSQTTLSPDAVALLTPVLAPTGSQAQSQLTGPEDARTSSKQEAIVPRVTPAIAAPLQTPAMRLVRDDVADSAIPAAAVENGPTMALSGSAAGLTHSAGAPQPAGAATSVSPQLTVSRANPTILVIPAVAATTNQTPATISNTGSATAAPAGSSIDATLAAAGLSLHLPTSSDSGAAAPTAQNAASAPAGAHGVQGISGPAANARGNDTSASPDKSSHQQNSDSAASGQTANAGNNSPAQHGADAGQASAAKTLDSVAPMVQTVGHPAVAGQIVGGHNAEAAASAEATRTASNLPGDANEPAAAGGINTARLIQTLGETGMQVGMRSVEFGDISIRTTVSQQQMTTQIAVDHGDLSRAIEAHVPAMQAKLGDDLGIRASIQVNQTATSFAGGQGDASAGQQRPYSTAVQPMILGATAEPEPIGSLAVAGDDDRLDIQA